jgi:hypothetical protein
MQRSAMTCLALLTLGSVLPALAAGPTLVPAALSSVTPAAVTRGQTVTLTLSGVNIQGATRALFDDPSITGNPVPGGNANQANVTVQIGPETRTGIHRVALRTPLGTTSSVTFAVGAWPEVAENEPNDGAAAAPMVSLPATLTGAMNRAGDADCFRFQAEAGQELVFEVVATQIRSRLSAVVALLDPVGKVLAETDAMDGRADPVLGYRFPKGGTYVLRIRDFENAGGGDVSYRINAGALPYAMDAFPLGVAKVGGEVTLRGYNLGETRTVRVSPSGSGWGAAAIISGTSSGPLHNTVRVAVGEHPEVMEAETPNDTPAAAQAVPFPCTVNGRISGDAGADVDCYRFGARNGQPLVLEVAARRFGSPLDSIIEVLDRNGKKVERATLRPVAETVLTLSDRDSATTGLRLLAWNDWRVNDFVYVGGELIQLVALPRGPDDDARFRSIRGQRAGFLDTTPVGHAMNTPIYKVQVHPPGKQFPPNGMPLFRLHYQNDDGGPLYGKDSRLLFTPPAEGEYLVRIADVRGEASDRHAYRLSIREARPDFRLSLGMEHPNIPAGASVPVDVVVDRLDGFDGEIALTLEGLPEGFSATSTTIEAGETTAALLLTAAPGAKTPDGDVRLRLVGRAKLASGEILREAVPAGGKSLVTVLPKADLTLRTALPKITLVAGQSQAVDVSITRENGFDGRVPVDVKNLPFGVRVDDVGLNGVLITESETSRRFVLVAEPFVKAVQRVIYCTVKTETSSPASTEIGVPVLLEVLPAGRRAAR